MMPAGKQKRRLLIVHRTQFGVHIDTYSYCKHLQDAYDVTYCCWDYGATKVELGGVRVIYVSRGGAKALRLGRFIATTLRELRSGGYDVVFVVYFQGCSLLRFLPTRFPMVLDVRTGSLRRPKLLRVIDNCGLMLESLLYRHVTIISQSLRRHLRISEAKSHLLPPGADVRPPFAGRGGDGLHLLYVGTLQNREIEKTVEGFARFYHEMNGPMKLSYDIVGEGPEEEKERVCRSIASSGCGDAVRYLGRIPYSHIADVLARSTVGVAFVPLKDFFRYQPVSKVVMYLLAGMPVLATATEENRVMIGPENGVLIPDTVDGFALGVKEIAGRMATFDRARIRETGMSYGWENIIHNNLLPYLRSLEVG
jgi:glycosyltransferase involved in cell wall biosynthesis